MNYILGVKFRDYGQIYFFTTPGTAPPASSSTAHEPHASADGAGVETLAFGRMPPSLEGDEAEVLDALGPSLCTPGTGGCAISVGDIVIAETGQGLGLGVVVHVSATPPANVAEQDLLPILRATTDKDLAAIAENKSLTADAFRYCTARIRNRELEMKLVDVEVLFDKTKFIFYFTAPTRIDFRELVKDLVREYHVRIELRQIGVRHETQMIGAVGNCGMVCCCRRFLRKFAPVTIKMAKEQNLFLNPAKISGICGRLLCCLSYEQENYDAFHRECPRLGKRYQTTQGDMKVLRANIFRNSIVALNSENEEVEFTLDEWRATTPRRPEGSVPQPGRPAGEKSQRPHDDGFMIVTGEPGSPYPAADDMDDDIELPEADDETDDSAATDAGAGSAGAPGDAGAPRHRRKRRRRPQA